MMLTFCPSGASKGIGCRVRDHRAHRLLEPLDAAVRDGDALAQPGRAQLLAGEQAVENLAAGDAVVVLEQQADLLEHALLAGDVEIDQDVRLGQQLGDQIHH